MEGVKVKVKVGIWEAGQGGEVAEVAGWIQPVPADLG